MPPADALLEAGVPRGPGAHTRSHTADISRDEQQGSDLRIIRPPRNDQNGMESLVWLFV